MSGDFDTTTRASSRYGRSWPHRGGPKDVPARLRLVDDESDIPSRCPRRRALAVPRPAAFRTRTRSKTHAINRSQGARASRTAPSGPTSRRSSSTSSTGLSAPLPGAAQAPAALRANRHADDASCRRAVEAPLVPASTGRRPADGEREIPWWNRCLISRPEGWFTCPRCRARGGSALYRPMSTVDAYRWRDAADGRVDPLSAVDIETPLLGVMPERTTKH